MVSLSRIRASKFDDYSGLFANGGRFDIPENYGVGFSWKVLPTWTLAYTHGFRKNVNGVNSIPASFGGGEANVHLQENIIGVAYGYKF